MSIISVVCVNLNGGKYLNKLLESLKSQSIYDDITLIFVDGGSTDNSLEIIKNHNGSKKIIENINEKHFVESYNLGFKESITPYIIQICSDDYLIDNNYLKKATDILELGNHDLIYSRSLDVDELYRPLRIIPALPIKPPSCKQDFFKFFAYTKFGSFPDGNVVSKREIFLECFPSEDSIDQCDLLIPHSIFLSNFLKKGYSIKFLDTIANGVLVKENRLSVTNFNQQIICLKKLNNHNYHHYFNNLEKNNFLKLLFEKIKVYIFKVYFSDYLLLSITEIIKKFDCEVVTETSTDVEVIYNLAKDSIESLQKTKRPVFMHLKYYRYLEHVGVFEDFKAGYRSIDVFEKWKKLDPVQLQRTKLLKELINNSWHGIAYANIEKKMLSIKKDIIAVEKEISEKILQSIRLAENAEFPDPSEAYKGVYA